MFGYVFWNRLCLVNFYFICTSLNLPISGINDDNILSAMGIRIVQHDDDLKDLRVSLLYSSLIICKFLNSKFWWAGEIVDL